jgi:hypothetical protein
MKQTQNHTRRVARLARLAWNSTFFIGCLAVPVAHAAITFQFEYGDPVGKGFKDPVYGAARQAALNTAASTFSSMFGSHFNNSGTITLKATASDDPYGSTMASAGSFAAPGSSPGFNLGEVVRTKLQNNGLDLNGNKADGVVNVNFGKLWNVDFNTPASSNENDFYTTIYHEFTHALGFSSIIEESGVELTLFRGRFWT